MSKAASKAVVSRLIVGSALAVYRTVFESKKIDGVLGHSVGEYAAAAIAGVIGDNDAMQLVARRADAMAEAAAKTPTSMAAVLGGEEADVLTALRQLELEPANFNGSGQIVAAGAKAAIQRLVANPPEKARVIELKVAGAFHTSFMEGQTVCAGYLGCLHAPARPRGSWLRPLREMGQRRRSTL